MKIIDFLDKISQQDSHALTSEISEKIESLKNLCDSEFYNQRFYGNAALNRQMLINESVAKLLTPDVIGYLFTNRQRKDILIYRNSTGYIPIQDAIYYGFSDGLYAVKFMPNNERVYNLECYQEQKEKYETNTRRIIKSIQEASGLEDEPDEQNPFDHNLLDRFEQIMLVINFLKKKGKSDELLYVPEYSTADMRDQALAGLACLCEAIQMRYEFGSLGFYITSIQIPDETLESLCEKFLINPKALLDGAVNHLFYDRVHIEAALEQYAPIQIGNEEYSMEQIFRTLISKLMLTPERYSDIAKEQFSVRFMLVENDLRFRFSCLWREALMLDNDAKQNLLSQNRAMSKFHNVLTRLKEKQETHLSEVETAKAIKKCWNSLEAAANNYFYEEGIYADYILFKQSCERIIRHARPILQEPDWNRLLTNIILAVDNMESIITTPTSPNSHITGCWQFRMFHPETDRVGEERTQISTMSRANDKMSDPFLSVCLL